MAEKMSEVVSVRLTPERRHSYESLASLSHEQLGTRDGGCAAFLRAGGRLLQLSLRSLGESVRERLARSWPRDTDAIVSAMVLDVLMSSDDCAVRYRLVDSWWVWVVVEGTVVRWGCRQAVRAAGAQPVVAFAAAMGCVSFMIADPVEFSSWLEDHRIGNEWLIGSTA